MLRLPKPENVEMEDMEEYEPWGIVPVQWQVHTQKGIGVMPFEAAAIDAEAVMLTSYIHFRMKLDEIGKV